jgi:hypothetical protein
MRVRDAGSYIALNAKFALFGLRNKKKVSAKVPKGVYVSKSAVVKDGVKMIPPVTIGDHALIESGAEIGPSAFIGNGAVIDVRAKIEETVVFPDTYVGRNVRLSERIVSKNCAVSAGNGRIEFIKDFSVLTSLDDKRLESVIAGCVSRLVGALGVVMAAPVLGPVFFCDKFAAGGRLLTRKMMLRHRGSYTSENNAFTVFEINSRFEILRGLPKVLNLLKGDMRLLGNAPISPDAFKAHKGERLMGRFSMPPGVISSPGIDAGERPVRVENGGTEPVGVPAPNRISDMGVLLGAGKGEKRSNGVAAASAVRPVTVKSSARADDGGWY